MRKKLLAFGLILALVFSVVGCSNDGGDTPPASSDGDDQDTDQYKVYLITMDQMDQHWVTVDKGAQEAAEELGNVDYTWLAPDVKDDAKQIESINNAVAGGA